MISFLLALAAWSSAPPPDAVVIATPRGEVRLLVEHGPRGAPMVAAAPLVSALAGTLKIEEAWAEVTLGTLRFDFLVGTPFYRLAGQTEVLAAPSLLRRDSIFVPFQFLVEVLPREFRTRYHYDGPRARLTELGGPATATAPATPAAATRLPNGLLPGHIVTVDPGHGGSQPGNPGRFLPRGVQEKDITLKVGLRLREALQRRGIQVIMTRTKDVNVPVLERAPMCSGTCDLFVSLHVDALEARRPNYQQIRGFHSLIIGEENTADASRVARMENEALRSEVAEGEQNLDDAMQFIFKDLQMNEYLRESHDMAERIQEHLSKVHPGTNRGVNQYNRLAVLNTAHRPAVLVEMGYATNRQDAAFLASESGQRKIAEAIADAVVDYLLEYEQKTGAVPGTAEANR